MPRRGLNPNVDDVDRALENCDIDIEHLESQGIDGVASYIRMYSIWSNIRIADRLGISDDVRKSKYDQVKSKYAALRVRYPGYTEPI